MSSTELHRLRGIISRFVQLRDRTDELETRHAEEEKTLELKYHEITEELEDKLEKAEAEYEEELEEMDRRHDHEIDQLLEEYEDLEDLSDILPRDYQSIQAAANRQRRR